MGRYEYTVEPFGSDVSWGAITEQLNALGSEGWMIVSVLQDERVQQINVFLMREVVLLDPKGEEECSHGITKRSCLECG